MGEALKAILPSGYGELLSALKDRIRAAQVRASAAVNRGMILLYWDIGRRILESQQQEGWGAKVVVRLSADLSREFPGMRGFSARNLKYMRALAESYPERAFVQAVPAQLTWYHNMILLDRVSAQKEREWYMRQAVANGWSGRILIHQIESRLIERQGGAVTNFRRTLPPPQSDLAQQMMKDPYTFDFLSLGKEARERDLERGLLDHLQRFLLELGAGFAFVGRQVRLEVGGQDFSLDLLFYHLRLRRYVVVELKAGPFKPEHSGKMGFYLAAVDDRLRHPEDRPSLGLILCKEADRVVVEYALRDSRRPIGVSEYRLTAALPKGLRAELPAIETLEREVGARLGRDPSGA